ncbi:helix-turn-helix domain-containing protein [Pseudomonas sp. GD03842]|uniref:IclR family transcriptional regulator domain-containing protein n=1 Tax=unclassified Pseudomonas TaxID=196821 RepID=UPI000D3A2846|nr:MULTISPECIES: IclR family transcriptional regulator C-terminal domain-containing protein [unclassified Pseudomonas]MDH0746858.1 helix-turn-helix domain-containing protein [Pseudomonas sp. GD03842]RAU43894.1 hypothetical protein DBP26_018785 [Pseudomonas sp. RIT 409]RAU56212.1 hypothetical protein DBY65_003560 [Pseudomonas sp. RIT 412]
MPQVPPANRRVQAGSPASSHIRLIEVIDALVFRFGAEPWGVRELAARLDESRSTVNRILLTLVEQGLALEAGAGKYTVGPRLNVLTNALIDRSALLQIGRTRLAEIADATGATVLLSIHSPCEGGYFVAACGEPKASLTFRPELGIMHPLSFGHIGQAFSAWMGPDACGQPGRADPADLTAHEFPEPLAVTVRTLRCGLLIAVSVHSADGAPAQSLAHISQSVSQFAEELDSALDGIMRDGERSDPVISLEDAKTTASRLERLMLIACALPQGVKYTVGLHDQLLCNAATAKRLMQSGLESEIVVSVDAVLYPGPKLFQWAARLGFRDNIADLTRSTVSRLVQETGETIAILAFDKTLNRAQFLDVIQGWRPIQYQLSVHTEVPLYAGAAGKAVLAFCEPDVIEAIDLVKLTDATITDRDALQSDLDTIAQRGWATGTGERVLGAFGLAVPFFVDGQIRGSISATIPQNRKDERDLPRLTLLMQEATKKIGRLLSLGI